MAEIKITVADDGPYVIEGGVNVVDQDGDSYEERDVIALCRCFCVLKPRKQLVN